MLPQASILDRTLISLPRQRICVVTETYPPEVNGVAITVQRCVQALRARGHEVRVVRPRQAEASDSSREEGDLLTGSLPIPGYPTLRMGVPCQRQLRELWRNWRPDVLHVITEGPLGWSALQAARALTIPVVADFHTNFHSYGRHYGWGRLSTLIYRYLRYFHNRAQVTLVPTRTLRDQLSIDGFKRIEVVARGVDTQLFHPGQRSATLRTAWGLSAGDLAVLYVGRLAPEKNLPLVHRAFAAIREVRPDARLVLVGDGPAGPLRDALGSDAVVYAGIQRDRALAQHFASADLFLFPSLTETFGNVTLEAMASGLPVVAYDYAAAGEHVQHGRSGWLAPFDDSVQFVEGARAIASSPALRETMGQAAALQCHSLGWEQVMDALERALVRVVHSEVHDSALPSRLVGRAGSPVVPPAHKHPSL